MAGNSLEAWSRAVRSSWGPLSTELVANCSRYLRRLLTAPVEEAWLAELLRDRPASRHLYEDQDHGFMLLAHSEQEGLYREPHDHGASWVIYAVLEGEMEMGSYALLQAPGGRGQLVKRQVDCVRAGDVRTYLPGDIHDTLCIRGPALLLRFTERDLRLEKEQLRLMRYSLVDGAWTSKAA